MHWATRTGALSPAVHDRPVPRRGMDVRGVSGDDEYGQVQSMTVGYRMWQEHRATTLVARDPFTCATVIL